MIFTVNFNVSKDGDVFYQNFCVESNSVDELFEKVKSQVQLIDGVVDNIVMSQRISKQKFERSDERKCEYGTFASSLQSI